MSAAGLRVAVCTVTHDSARHLEGWWRALLDVHAHQHHHPHRVTLRVVVVDCASVDGSAERVEELASQRPGPTLELVRCRENLGFAGGMNRALARLQPKDRWALPLNPDARPEPEAVQIMVDAFRRYLPVHAEHTAGSARIGSVTPRLVRPGGDAHGRRLDACGMVWTRSWRHLDRGSGEPDDGRFGEAEEVFAGTGAATLFAVGALDDVALRLDPADEHRVFDEDFHSYREDAELGLRLQRRGWSCVYEPAAVIVHERHNLPERRAEMSVTINRHSLKNRYLLRLLHQSSRNVLLTLPALVRDLGILAFVLVRERSSLGAYRWLWRHRRRVLRRRRWLRDRQTVPDARVDRWFGVPSLPLRRAPGLEEQRGGESEATA